MQAIQQLFDHLAYVSYRTQRELGVSSETCAKMGYANVEEMEAQYTKGAVLAITEDGINLRKGDKYWVVYDDLSFMESDTTKAWPTVAKFKIFSTEKIAGNFIIDCLANDTF